MSSRELALRRTIPLVINSYNQHTYLRNLISKFFEDGFNNIYVIDNESTHPPLLEYYKELRYTKQASVLYYNKNNGPHYFFTATIYRMLFEGTPFLYTDPDLNFPTIHENFLSHLFDISKRYNVFKVGSALTIPSLEQQRDQSLRVNFEGKEFSLQEWEGQFWKNQIAPDIYSAPIDTTLHLFNTELYPPGAQIITGLRVSGPGFEAIHRPWFADDPCPAGELDYYRRDAVYSNWV